MPKQAKTTKTFNYAKAFRWFTAEFLVVLSGVLVAVALGNYFKQREIQANNQQYLADLLQELQHNEAEVETNLEVEKAGARAANLLMMNIDSAQNMSMDSIRQWLSSAMNSTLNFRPAMGMVKTLIMSGSVNSLKNLKLRSAIINYEQEANELIDFFSQGLQLEFQQVNKLIEQGNVNRILVDYKGQKPILFHEMRKNENYTKLFLMSYVLYSNRILVYEGFLEQIKILKTQLEEVLEVQPTKEEATKHQEK